MIWESFSDWLITVGLIMAGFAIIAFVIDFIGGKQIRALSWPYAVGYALAVLLSLINAFVHSRDSYTAVVPTGLTLSAPVVVILLFTGWVGWAPISRRRVAREAGFAGKDTNTITAVRRRYKSKGPFDHR